MKRFKEFRKRFWEMAEEAGSIVITGHVGPDDDSIASVLATYWLVRERFPGKDITMIYSGEETEAWNYFEGFERIKFVGELVDWLGKPDSTSEETSAPLRPPSEEKSLSTPATASCLTSSCPTSEQSPEATVSEKKSLLIVLDGSSFDRFSKKPEKLKKLFKKTICIDHHKNKPDEFDLLYVSSDLSSAVEGVYRLLVDKNKKMPKRLAEIFLLGILGDTGNFAYLNKKNAKVLRVVEKLISEAEVGIQELQSKYRQYSKKTLRLIGEMVSNTMYFDDVGKWPPFQVSILKKKLVEDGVFSDEEISRASHLYMSGYLRLVRGYGWGFVITPREGERCSLSFRSLPGVVNVRKIAEKFNGGGHDLASGGEIEVKNPKEALKTVLEWMKMDSH